MTDIRASGFRNKAELQEHLDDVDGDVAKTHVEESEALRRSQREVAQLRRQVAELRERLYTIHSQTATMPPNQEDRSWLRIAVTIGVSVALGRLAQRLRLGAAGAVAVPMIAAQLDRRLW